MVWESTSNVFFRTLFTIAEHKDTWITDLWSGPKEGAGWNPCFTRPLDDWALDEVVSFLIILGSKFVRGGRIQVEMVGDKRKQILSQTPIPVIELVHWFFPLAISIKVLCATKDQFDCVGSNLEQAFSNRPTPGKVISPCKQVLPLSSEWGDCRAPSCALCNYETFMGSCPISFRSDLGESEISGEHLGELERFYIG